MTTKQQITHGAIQNVCHLRNGIFPFHSTCATLCQFYFIASAVLFTKNNKLWNERKEEFLYIWLLKRITFYQRR